jgi:hypothetical protein
MPQHARFTLSLGAICPIDLPSTLEGIIEIPLSPKAASEPVLRKFLLSVFMCLLLFFYGHMESRMVNNHSDVCRIRYARFHILRVFWEYEL